MRYQILVLWALFIVMPAFAADEWVEAPVTRSLPGAEEKGKTYFSKFFGKRTGTFEAMYSSMFDPRDSVSGEFLVGKFRYTYDKPIEGGYEFYPTHDEVLTEVLLDCNEQLSGTLSIVYKLKGAVVHASRSTDEDIEMMQVRGPATTNDLCDFARSMGVTD